MTLENKIATIISIFAGIIISIALYILYRHKKYEIKSGELQGDNAISNFDVMTTWDTQSNEKIKTLHPKIRQIYIDVINDLEKQGIKYRLYSGLRTFDLQDELYGKGRTEQQLIAAGVNPKYAKPTEKIVTNAKHGMSFHNYGLAADGVEIVNDKAIWNSPNEQKIIDTMKKYGLFWGGDFNSLKDKPHSEYQKFGSITQLLALYNSGKVDANGYVIV